LPAHFPIMKLMNTILTIFKRIFIFLSIFSLKLHWVYLRCKS
jgi:hypothetical protein